MNKILDKKYPYLSSFFETAVRRNRLFHSLIFYGSSNFIQYALALEIARQLNCLEDKKEDCNCRNCRWIRENRHPAVMTISKIDNKTDASKTVISEEQINMVLDKLVNSSDYHRVFIFCDAEIKILSGHEKTEYEEFIQSGYNLPQEISEGRIWHPSGVNKNCFSDVSANAMLKSIEEPLSNVTFIFLTDNKDDMLRTIISRSQSFYTASVKHIEYKYKFFERYFSKYPDFEISQSLDFARTLLDYQLENNLKPVYIIDCIQYYLTEILKNNSSNKVIMNIIFRDIKETEKAKQMIKSYIKEQTVYENLAFYFAKRKI